MQRRAAAALFVFFLVMGVSAYSVIALAEAPTINLEQEETYSQGDSFVIDGQRYNVSELSIEQASGGGGGHGGGGGGEAAPTGTITWTIQNATHNKTLQNGSTIDFNNGTYLATTGVAPNTSAVVTGGGNGSGNASGGQSGNASGNQSGNGTSTPGAGAAGGGNTTSGNTSNTTTAVANATGNASAGNGSGNASGNQSGVNTGTQSGNQSNASNASNASSSGGLEPAPNTLVLTEQQDVEAILQNDSAVYNSTVTAQGQEYVRYRSNGSFVPLAQYLPEADQQRFSEGDTLTYQNQTVRVANVTNTASNSSAVLQWTAPREDEASLEEGGNVTLANGESFIANFITKGHGNDTTVQLQLSQNFEEYQRQQQLVDSFHSRINGLWGVLIISGIAAFLVIVLAYMPVRG